MTGWSASGVRAAGLDHQPREADELRVELLVEHAGRALRGLDGLQRARDVRAVGVVLRVGDLAAGRDQDDQRDADRRALVTTATRDRPAQPRAGAMRIANATSRPSAGRGSSDDQRDQLAQVVASASRASSRTCWTSSGSPSPRASRRSRSTVCRSTRRRTGAGSPRSARPSPPAGRRRRARPGARGRSTSGSRRPRAVLRLRVADQREVAADQRGGDDGEATSARRAIRASFRRAASVDRCVKVVAQRAIVAPEGQLLPWDIGRRERSHLERLLGRRRGALRARPRRPRPPIRSVHASRRRPAA